MNPIPTEDFQPALEPAAEATLRVAILLAGGAVFAVAADPVREVIPARSSTPLPTAPRCVLGLVNHRGRVVTVVDLASLLDRSSSAPPSRLLLVDHGDRRIAVAVEDVLRIATLRIGPGSGAAPTGAAAPMNQIHLLGIVEVDGRAIPVLDLDALLHPLFEWRSPPAAALRQE